jgi:hypothetical protein
MLATAAGISGLLFAAVAVWVRRRFDTEELIAASAAGFVVLGGLVVAFGWTQDDFLYGPALGATFVGIAAAAFTVEQLVTRSIVSEPAREAVIGYVAYVVGAIVGFYVGFLFSLRGLGWG